MYKELVEYLVKNLVVNKDAVTVSLEVKEDKRSIIKVKVASEDMGRLIGKDGRIIRSIRNIVSAYAGKSKERATVEIVEEKVD